MNTIALPAVTADRRRWIALVVVCLAQLMIVLDTTIVNVALPVDPARPPLHARPT